MRRIKYFILVIAVCLCTSFAFSGCTLVTDGTNGKSAYEIAVENGFEGTELEWLNSLRGTNGTDGTNGTNGTNGIDGINGSPGQNGEPGEDGKSCTYEDAVLYGFTGTEAEWLEYLSGKKGADGSASVAYAANKALKSVVSIVCTFSYQANRFGNMVPVSTISSGSGVIMISDKENGNAYIVTNYHVVYSSEGSVFAETTNVYLYGFEYTDFAIPATYIGGSQENDIAVLKINNSNTYRDSVCVAATIADSESIYVGDTALIVGNSKGEGISVTSGNISVVSELIAVEDTTDEIRVIRTDAAINPGNSGGGLFNEDGNLIGITNAKVEDIEIESMGYAIPTNLAIAVAQNIVRNCNGETITTPVVCIVGIDYGRTIRVDDGVIAENRLTIVDTVIITSINQSSVANEKLQVNDIIRSISINGETYNITRIYQLGEAIYWADAGDIVRFNVLRNGLSTDVDITMVAP